MHDSLDEIERFLIKRIKENPDESLKLSKTRCRGL